MLKTSLVQAHCNDGMICVSENLIKLLKNEPNIQCTFKWKMHKMIQIFGDFKTQMQLYKMELQVHEGDATETILVSMANNFVKKE